MACIRKVCSFEEKMIEGTCTPLLPKRSGFCLDYRISVVFPFIEMSLPKEEDLLKIIYSGIIFENPMSVKQNEMIFKKLSKITVNKDKRVQIKMAFLRKIQRFVNVKALIHDLLTRLDDFNTNATWKNVSYHVKLTETPYENKLSDDRNMASFRDTDTDFKYHCNVIFAMSEIQNCPAVETKDFRRLTSEIIQVMYIITLFHKIYIVLILLYVDRLFHLCYIHSVFILPIRDGAFKHGSNHFVYNTCL